MPQHRIAESSPKRRAQRLRALLHLALPASLILLVLCLGQLQLTIAQQKSFAYLPFLSNVSGANIAIEVSQVHGQQQGRYVAGKDAAVLLYFDNPTTADAARQKVVVKRDGTAVATLEPQAVEGNPNALSFTCPNRAACGDWQSGTYSFEAQIDGSQVSADNLNFVARRDLRVLAVPVKVAFGTTVKAPADDSWKTAGDFILQVYPVAPAQYKWEIGQELDVSSQNIESDDGQRAVWEALANLQPPQCRDNNAGAGCFDKIIGFVAERPNGTLNGYTYGSPANIVAIQSGMRRTVAHEVGHNFSLGDEYEGGQYNCQINPTPPSFIGKDFNRKENPPFNCTDQSILPFTDTGTASRIVAAQVHPFEIGGRGLLTNDLGNFMGNMSDPSKAWASPSSWKQIFDQLAPLSAATTMAVPARYMAAAGFISKAGVVTLEPWDSFSNADPSPAESGSYSIQAVDGSGTLLASQGFDVVFDVPDQAKEFDSAPFGVEVPFPANTVAFRILKGTTLLKTVPVSPNPPSLSIVAPTAGQVVSSTFTVSWTASDPDSDPLTFDVEYNDGSDPEGWITLATNITTTTWVDDASTLPGGTNARIRVRATDGTNAVEAESAPFSVPPRAPEVYIEDPVSRATYAKGASVTLEGSAYDSQDDWIFADNALTWTSDRDGMLGHGPLLFVDTLSVGLHTITLSAKNSQGLTSTASVVVIITP